MEFVLQDSLERTPGTTDKVRRPILSSSDLEQQKTQILNP